MINDGFCIILSLTMNTKLFDLQNKNNFQPDERGYRGEFGGRFLEIII